MNCKANAFALEGYLEAVQATNGFENAVAKWNEVGCYFSVTGHGLGGAHSVGSCQPLRIRQLCR